ncbi:general secretion pathway protein GspE [Pokkaliibacter plantistimulans]|uniref:Type II secretion system protein E n=2 Tax=Pokkaliibacter plantistimulans TaxID=1635171 RepID=A0ABX5M1P4_9GAMM|nr:general secretion pathway protein GspE [Pokkaliibacter plantistimulans]
MLRMELANIIKPDDLERAQRLYNPVSDGRFSAFLVRLGLVSERDLAEHFAAQYQLPRWQGDEAQLALLDVAALPEVSLRFLRQHKVFPYGWQSAAEREATQGEPLPLLQVVLADPEDRYVVDALSYACEAQVAVSIGLASDIDELLERYYGQGRSAMGSLVESIGESGDVVEDVEHLKDLASEAPVIRLVNLLIQRAVERRASDIHIEPFENRLKVRYRVDGVLQDSEAPPVSSTAAVISRIKIMARLNIAERRLPQDGRIMMRVQGQELDLRVSTVPTSFGESVVMRLLQRETVRFDFASLGMDEATRARFRQLLDRPHGVVLVTGPTGSGKTTTLYTALSALNTSERKIITVEDPVEYQLEGINQIQVKPAIGLDFAQALRSIVRQDPDVIMIGEMRDLETCRIAIQSALTGHLVLSTLHTNSAAASITRLLDMGVEDYLLVSTINAILAQRLVRRLDPALSEAYEPLPEVTERYQLQRYAHGQPIRLYRPRAGLAAGEGYLGRCAITELLVLSDSLRKLVMQRADASLLEQEARRQGMLTLYEDGLRLALQGVTTLDEVLRITYDGSEG